MSELLAENLSGKSVMGSDGAELGMLYNITMNMDTGRLENLLVEPADSYRGDEFQTDESGRMLIPVHRVTAVKDHMIIDR
jgi:sporulation protein YlmC with PRC-barrel domain